MTSKAALLAGLRLILALALLLGGDLFLRHSSAGHHSPSVHADGNGQQGELQDAAAHEEHSHDDGSADKSSGHNAVDHSHVTLGLAAQPAGLTRPDSNLLWQESPDLNFSAPNFPLERPPRGPIVA